MSVNPGAGSSLRPPVLLVDRDPRPRAPVPQRPVVPRPPGESPPVFTSSASSNNPFNWALPLSPISASHTDELMEITTGADHPVDPVPPQDAARANRQADELRVLIAQNCELEAAIRRV